MKNQYSTQQFTCEKTSRNFVSKVITQSLAFIPSGSSVLDYGGGKYDKGTQKFADNGINSFVYDPFNRSDDHNVQIKPYYDYAVCGNVLNVIAEKSIRAKVVTDIMNRTNTAFLTVYEGDKSGKGTITRDGFQNNQEIDFYVDEIKKLGYSVTVKNKLITIKIESASNEIARLFKNKYATLKAKEYQVK